jgi:hypothetical protein
MNPRNMDTLGLAISAMGALFIALGGAYFYELFQTISTASVTGSTADLVRLSNSMLAMPVLITLTIFGLGMLTVGGTFMASAHITEQLVGNRGGQNLTAQTIADTRPARMCTKCGTLLYQSSAYCPSCGNPIATVPKISP